MSEGGGSDVRFDDGGEKLDSGERYDDGGERLGSWASGGAMSNTMMMDFKGLRSGDESFDNLDEGEIFERNYVKVCVFCMWCGLGSRVMYRLCMGCRVMYRLCMCYVWGVGLCIGYVGVVLCMACVGLCMGGLYQVF